MNKESNEFRSYIFKQAKERLCPFGLGKEMRLEFELDRIERLGWIDYFIMARGLESAIRKSGGVIGPGRGACAGSAVVHTLGLNDVNPVEEQLLFQRFLNERLRPDAPILLVDVDSIGYQAGIAFLKSIDADAYAENRKSEIHPEIWKVGRRSIGLTKVPALNKASCVLSLIRASFGRAIEFGAIPYDDEQAWSVLKRAETDDLTALTSSTAKKSIKSANLGMTSLTALIAMERPGTEMFLEEYIARSNGSSTVTSLHPIIDDVLSETYGIMIYQEQLIRLLRFLADFNAEKAICCYKALSMRKMEEINQMRDSFISGCLSTERFRVSGLEDDSMVQKCAMQIWKNWEKTSSYLFMKAHASAEAILLYRMAYLKAHFPAQWKCSL